MTDERRPIAPRTPANDNGRRWNIRDWMTLQVWHGPSGSHSTDAAPYLIAALKVWKPGPGDAS